MTERDAIFALLPDSSGAPIPKPFVRTTVAGTDLWVEFESRLAELGGRVIGEEDLAAVAGKSVFADEDAQPFLAHLLEGQTSDVWSAELGVTLADCAVAETGTVLIENRPGRSRLASLAPPVHIVLLRDDCMVASLDEAIARIGGRTAVFITGPSRTADIGGTLIRGAHGPKELWVVRLTSTG